MEEDFRAIAEYYYGMSNARYLLVGNEEVQLNATGKGGSKRAFDIGEDRVILLPQPECCRFNMWNRIVKEEVLISQQYEKLGLLTPPDNLKPEFHKQNTYISDSFASLSKRGIYIMDMKNEKSSTWFGSVFNNLDIDLTDPKIWHRLLDKMVDELIVLVRHDYGFNGERR